MIGTIILVKRKKSDTDVIIGFASISNTPEYNAWHQVSQKYDLRYLEMPRGLRERLAKKFDLQLVDTPPGLFRGVDRPIPTIASFGTAVYGRTDMPDEFAYTLAKALDEQQELLAWTHMAWSYNRRNVWTALDVPLHHGAAKYYREVGYME